MSKQEEKRHPFLCWTTSPEIENPVLQLAWVLQREYNLPIEVRNGDIYAADLETRTRFLAVRIEIQFLTDFREKVAEFFQSLPLPQTAFLTPNPEGILYQRISPLVHQAIKDIDGKSTSSAVPVSPEDSNHS